MSRKKINLLNGTNFSPSIKSNRDIFTDVTLDDFLNLFETFYKLKTMEGLAERSLNDYRIHLDYFKKFCYEEERTSSIRCVDSDLLRAYLHYMIHEKQFKPCTINVRLRTLKAFLKWLYKEEYTKQDLSTKLKLVKVPQDTISPLSESDIKKMLRVPDRKTYSGLRDFIIMILMLDTGIRVNECVNLKTNDIDLKSGLVTVRAEIAKTRVFRQLPISLKTCKLLKELIEISKENHCNNVFMSAYGESITADRIIHNFSRYGKCAGISDRCTPHVFRHTFATNFVRAGGDIFTLQRILGHTTLAMCRRYIQLNTNDLIKKHKQTGLVDRYIK